MAYTLTTEQGPGYLHFRVTGLNTTETLSAYLRDVAETCARLKAQNVLVEENLEGPGLSLGQIFGVAASAGPEAAASIRRFAYVDTNPGHEPSRMRFAENVAANRGLNIRVFRTVDEARGWLTGGGGGAAGESSALGSSSPESWSPAP